MPPFKRLDATLSFFSATSLRPMKPKPPSQEYGKDLTDCRVNGLELIRPVFGYKKQAYDTEQVGKEDCDQAEEESVPEAGTVLLLGSGLATLRQTQIQAYMQEVLPGGTSYTEWLIPRPGGEWYHSAPVTWSV